MKRTLWVAALLCALAPGLNAASSDKVYDIAAILSNTFEGSTPGNHLTLDLRPIVVDPNHPHDLFLVVSGQFENDNIRQQGMLPGIAKRVPAGAMPTKFLRPEALRTGGFGEERRGGGKVLPAVTGARRDPSPS